MHITKFTQPFSYITKKKITFPPQKKKKKKKKDWPKVQKSSLFHVIQVFELSTMRIETKYQEADQNTVGLVVVLVMGVGSIFTSFAVVAISYR